MLSNDKVWNHGGHRLGITRVCDRLDQLTHLLCAQFPLTGIQHPDLQFHFLPGALTGQLDPGEKHAFQVRASVQLQVDVII